MEVGTYIVISVLTAVLVMAMCIVLLAIKLLREVIPEPIVVVERREPQALQGIQCYICMERVATAMLVDCGHAGLCMECGKRLLATHRGCPLCRAPITRVMQVDIVEIP